MAVDTDKVFKNQLFATFHTLICNNASPSLQAAGTNFTVIF
jgi:hypothetical protein